jgi:DMSO/TMAO reductase YedYZ molybdopterin-dependent catalytic subunit
VLHDGVFLAYNMHGQQLSKEQGYPLRLVIAGSGGGDWMRWVTNIRLNPASVIMANRPLVIQGEDATQPSARKMFCSGLCKIH